MQADLTHDVGVGDVTVSISRDVMQVYGSEGVRSGDMGLHRVGLGAANALAQESQFICIRCVPRVFVHWVVT